MKRKRGRPPKRFVLGQNETSYAESGITRKRAWVAAQYAAIPPEAFEAYLVKMRAKGRAPSEAGLLRIAATYTGADVEDTRIKINTEDPAKAAWDIAHQCGGGFVGELIAFLREYLEMAKEVSKGAHR
jgi:hypothetical protein